MREESFFRQARIAQILAHPFRLRLLHTLADRPEGAFVNELVDALAVPQPKVSQHLARLREAGLVQTQRQGLYVRYRVHPEVLELLRTLERTASQLPVPPWRPGGPRRRGWARGKGPHGPGPEST
ncbi:MAG: winged helix-turn-helix transcriptional regulator [Chloroflexi bacterium]|nr:winged helix-turn-helix transcriptional regulator [Chloroflexota bacterium]